LVHIIGVVEVVSVRRARPSLLDVGVFIGDVPGENDALGDHARPTTAVSHSRSSHLAVNDQLDLFRKAQIQRFANDFLKEAPAVDSAVPDLSEGELGLPG